MSRDSIFDPFLDDIKGVKKKSKKDKKKEKENESLYGPASFDFGDKSDDDDTYGTSSFSKKESNKKEKVTIQTLFEFKPWEIAVLVVELILVLYLILVVTRVLPIF